MKKILLAILAVFASVSVFAFDIFSYVPINGNPRSYTCTEYSISTKFGEYFKTPVSKVTQTFDASKRELESSEYTARDVLVNRLQKSYDSSGRLSSQTLLNANGDIVVSTIYTYKNGVLVDASDYGKDNSLKGKVVYTYDERRLVDETGYDAKGALVWKIVYQYDGNQLIKTSQYFSDGSLDEEFSYTYKNDGTIDTITTYNEIDGSKQQVFRYSPDGQLNEITTYGNGGKVLKRMIVKYEDNNVSRVSDYAVAEKFGTTVNELIYMAEYTYLQ